MPATDTTRPDTTTTGVVADFLAPPEDPRERHRRGKAIRTHVTRTELGHWRPAADRPDPVDLIAGQESTRVPDLLALRHERMLASPFTFFRGAALLMASDLAPLPRTDLVVQLCGDAHLSNFGVYAAPDRRLVFSLNDFDETLPGPFEWDVKRLAASFAVAGRSRGFATHKRAKIIRAACEAYREAMADFADRGTLDVWYARVDAQEILERYGDEASSRQRRNFDKVLTKARSKNSLRALAKLTHVVDGQLRFISDPPLVVPVEDLVDDQDGGTIDERIASILQGYLASVADDRRHLLAGFHYVHLARKVVGVGSVGTRAWVVLLQGRDTDDPLLLQVKEAEASVLEQFLGASDHANHGERVVSGQRLMQSASDILLGWIRATGLDGVERDFYVRQLWDEKGSADVDRMKRSGMKAYARLCGWTLARAHARSGDPFEIAGYLGTGSAFDKAMAVFAEDYADQNDRDHAAVQAAVHDGRLA